MKQPFVQRGLVALAGGDDALEVFDLPPMLGEQRTRRRLLRPRGGDFRGGAVASGEPLRLHGIELRGALPALRLGLADRAFVLGMTRAACSTAMSKIFSARESKCQQDDPPESLPTSLLK